jgi:hypothetical protein
LTVKPRREPRREYRRSAGTYQTQNQESAPLRGLPARPAATAGREGRTMIRVKWWVAGGSSWSQDFPEGEVGANESMAKINSLRSVGFYTRSRAGVEVYYLPHHINKITRRVVPPPRPKRRPN